MMGIALNESNKTVSETPAKLMLIINFIDKGNADRHGFFETLRN